MNVEILPSRFILTVKNYLGKRKYAAPANVPFVRIAKGSRKVRATIN
jgi:hypothetical protein